MDKLKELAARLRAGTVLPRDLSEAANCVDLLQRLIEEAKK